MRDLPAAVAQGDHRERRMLDACQCLRGIGGEWPQYPSGGVSRQCHDDTVCAQGDGVIARAHRQPEPAAGVRMQRLHAHAAAQARTQRPRQLLRHRRHAVAKREQHAPPRVETRVHAAQRFCHHASNDRAVAHLQLLEARQQCRDAEVFRIAGVESADQRVEDIVEQFAAEAPAHEGSDRLVIGAAAHEGFGEQPQASAQAEETRREETERVDGQGMRPAIAHQVAATNRVALVDALVIQPKRSDQGFGAGRRRDHAVGAMLHQEARALFGLNAAAGRCLPIQNHDLMAAAL